MREGSRPSFLYLKYYRYLEHVGVNEDFNQGYRDREEFERWREIGMSLGFHHVQSSPLTRSSYHARQQSENQPRIYADARG